MPEANWVRSRLPVDVPPIERRDCPAERRLEAQFSPPADPEAARLVALLRQRMRRHGLECDDAGNVLPGTISTEPSRKSCAPGSRSLRNVRGTASLGQRNNFRYVGLTLAEAVLLTEKGVFGLIDQGVGRVELRAASLRRKAGRINSAWED